MTRENPRWGHMRVLGELYKLGFRVSLQTVRGYRKDVQRDPRQSWRTFLTNHRPQIWAADFFTVQTLTFQTLYVFFLRSPWSLYRRRSHRRPAWVPYTDHEGTASMSSLQSQRK